MSDETLNSEFEDLLERCLDAVLQGQASVEECAARYPQHAAPLKAALSVALLTARLKSPKLPAARVAALEARLLGQAAPARVIAFPQVWRLSGVGRVAAALMVALLIAFGSGGGLVAAAADDMPDDALYGLKRFWESVVVVVASITGQLDEVWLRLAETRLMEIQDAASANHPVSADLLDDWHTATRNAVSYAGATPAALVEYLESAEAAALSPQIQWPDASVQTALLGVIQPALAAYTSPNETPALPSPQNTPDAPTMTATPTQTAIMTATEPPLLTATETALPSATPTLLIPATPTRTPTPTITPTPTLTPTITPRSDVPTFAPPTFTPTPVILNPAPVTPVPGTPQSIFPTPTGTWYPYPRLTQDVFYLTRTAIPLPTANSGD